MTCRQTWIGASDPHEQWAWLGWGRGCHPPEYVARMDWLHRAWCQYQGVVAGIVPGTSGVSRWIEKARCRFCTTERKDVLPRHANVGLRGKRQSRRDFSDDDQRHFWVWKSPRRLMRVRHPVGCWHAWSIYSTNWLTEHNILTANEHTKMRRRTERHVIWYPVNCKRLPQWTNNKTTVQEAQNRHLNVPHAEVE